MKLPALGAACVALLFMTAVAAMTTGSTDGLYVRCGGTSGLTSINAAIKMLQYTGAHGPSMITVSGNCHENVVIQGLDHLTLNAISGASVSDASGGKADVIAVYDSHDISINGFTVNGGSDGVSGTNGISCNDWSSCRLSLNLVQGAGSGGGFAVFQASEGTVDGDTFQNNGAGLIVYSGSKLRAGGSLRPITAQNNGTGISVNRDGFAYLSANVRNNTDKGVHVRFHSTLELASGSITGSAGIGAYVHEGSSARFSGGMSIQGNGGPGVLVSDLSMVNFAAVVSGNAGPYDVECDPQSPVTRGVGTTGGTTNCVEP
jgi:hypothetical protein